MTYPIKCIIPSNRQLFFKDSALTIYERKEVLDKDELAEGDCISENKGMQVEVIDQNSYVHKLSAIEIGDFFGFTYVTRIVFLHESDLRNYSMWSLNSVCINVIDEEASADDLMDCAGADGKVSSHKLEMDLLTHSQILVAQIRSMLEDGGILDNLFVRYIPDIDDCVIGYGLFVRERVEIGTMIGEYVGILHTSALTPSSYSLNYPSSDGNREINASEYGNLIRFVNHSSNPNSSFQHFLHDEILHTVCVSLRIPLTKIIIYQPSYTIQSMLLLILLSVSCSDKKFM